PRSAATARQMCGVPVIDGALPAASGSRQIADCSRILVGAKTATAGWRDAAPGRTGSNASVAACYTARHFDFQA
ncbi:hypothetical protein PH586_21425, partial [Pseudomonas sp. SA3-5]